MKLGSWGSANPVVVLDIAIFTLDIMKRMWYQFSAMYIRKVRKTDKRTGKSYFYHQLIEAYRTPKGPRQRILLNLGKLDLDDRERKMLADRIEQLITGQLPFMPPPDKIEQLARRFASKLRKELVKKEEEKQDKEPKENAPQWKTVDINSVECSDVRSAGGELVGSWAYDTLGVSKILSDLGFSKQEIDRAKVLIIGKLLNPGSELEIYRWFNNISALDEVGGIKQTSISLSSLYRISDKLVSFKEDIEKLLVEKERKLFGLGEKLILYDLTNTYFEGCLRSSDLSRRGHSKERRNDRPLVTVALVIDEDGFPKTSRLFPGNVSEPSTLEKILNDLLVNPPRQLNFGERRLTVVIDAGIATEENLRIIRKRGLDYICVDRRKTKNIPDGESEVIHESENTTVEAVRIKEGDEIFLYCKSTGRALKEESIKNRFQKRFEEELTRLRESLHRKGGIKRYEKVLERIGRLKERYSRISHFYEISVKEDKGKAVEISWRVKNPEHLEVGFSGTYRLRTSIGELSSKELWSIYNMLSKVEASFKSLKSELSIRPIYHRVDKRIKGHIFATILAYHLLCVIQRKLHESNINFSWKTIRKLMSSHARITTSMTTNNGRTIYIRLTSQAEDFHMMIYNALGVSLKSLQVIRKTR